MTASSQDRNQQRPILKIIPILACLFIAAGLLMLMPELALRPSKQPARLRGYFERHAEPALLRDGRFPLAEMSETLALYLKGECAEAQVMLPAEGGSLPAFSGRELEHLKDVRSLYRLARYVLFAGLGFLLAAAILSLVMAEGRFRAAAIRFLGWLSLGALLGLVMVLLVSVYVLSDFSSAFTLFHLSLFSNDLWLLDPQNDMLLRLMPESFFIAFFRDALLRAIGLLLALVILPFAVVRLLKGKRISGGNREKREGGRALG